MSNRKSLRFVAFAGPAAAVLIADQLAKAAAISNLTPGVSVPFLGNVVRLYLVFNNSAAFSMGFGITWIFTLLSSLAAVALVVYALRLRSTLWLVLTGVALGGVLGNLTDRLFRAPGFPSGEVVDFIQIPFNFAIFNIADSAICVVAGIVVVLVARGRKIGG